MEERTPEQLADHAQKKKMQMEIMLKETDVKRIGRAMLEIEVSMRDIKHKQAQLASEYISKELAYKKLVSDQVLMQNELIKMKHKMNNIGQK